MKRLALLITLLLPFNKLRIACYRWLCGYDISWDSKVGPGNWLEVEECTICGARIGFGNLIQARRITMAAGSEIRRGNKFRYLEDVAIGPGATIVSDNTVAGTRGNWSPYKGCEKFTLGAGSIVTKGHYVDASCGVTVGDDVTFAGSGIQIWTHGFDLNHTMILAPVVIGNSVYIGSRSLVLQGVSVASDVSVGAGTVVSKSIDEPGFYVSSHLVRKADVSDYREHQNVVECNGARYVRK